MECVQNIFVNPRLSKTCIRCCKRVFKLSVLTQDSHSCNLHEISYWLWITGQVRALWLLRNWGNFRFLSSMQKFVVNRLTVVNSTFLFSWTFLCCVIVGQTSKALSPFLCNVVSILRFHILELLAIPNSMIGVAKWTFWIISILIGAWTQSWLSWLRILLKIKPFSRFGGWSIQFGNCRTTAQRSFMYLRFFLQRFVELNQIWCSHCPSWWFSERKPSSFDVQRQLTDSYIKIAGWKQIVWVFKLL